jgi:hypothetical protein
MPCATGELSPRDGQGRKHEMPRCKC